jgi:hypothetical protein
VTPWAVAPSLFRVAATQSAFWGLWVCSLSFYYISKGVSPPLLGDTYGCPRHYASTWCNLGRSTTAFASRRANDGIQRYFR